VCVCVCGSVYVWIYIYTEIHIHTYTTDEVCVSIPTLTRSLNFFSLILNNDCSETDYRFFFVGRSSVNVLSNLVSSSFLSDIQRALGYPSVSPSCHHPTVFEKHFN
jgi:hypothetical protein